MRTEKEILTEYDQERQKYMSVEKTEDYIIRVNYLIKDAIRALRPCYRGSTNYNHAEIYPPDASHFNSECIEQRYQGLYDLWHKAPYSYEITDADRVRINGILDQHFTLDKFKEVIDMTTKVNGEWCMLESRLLDEYTTLPKDMERLLDTYLDCLRESHTYINPLLEKFILTKCKIMLTVRV
jgi:hypothetical protein